MLFIKSRRLVVLLRPPLNSSLISRSLSRGTFDSFLLISDFLSFCDDDDDDDVIMMMMVTTKHMDTLRMVEAIFGLSLVAVCNGYEICHAYIMYIIFVTFICVCVLLLLFDDDGEVPTHNTTTTYYYEY